MPAEVLILGGWSYGLAELSPLHSAVPAGSAIDMPHLGSFAQTDFTAACAGYVQDRHFDLIIGWSMGAMLTLELLCERSDLTERALLFAPCVHFLHIEEAPWGPSADLLNLMKSGLQHTQGQTLNSFRSSAARPEHPIPVQETWATASLLAGLDYLARFDLRDRTQHLQTPMNVIHGRSDGIIHCRASRDLRERVSAVNLLEVPKAGHDLCLRLPEVRTWIAKSLKGQAV